MHFLQNKVRDCYYCQGYFLLESHPKSSLGRDQAWNISAQIAERQRMIYNEICIKYFHYNNTPLVLFGVVNINPLFERCYLCFSNGLTPQTKITATPLFEPAAAKAHDS